MNGLNGGAKPTLTSTVVGEFEAEHDSDAGGEVEVDQHEEREQIDKNPVLFVNRQDMGQTANASQNFATGCKTGTCTGRR